jgi:hypothetical protein
MDTLIKKIKESNITSVFTTDDLLNIGLDKLSLDEMLKNAIINNDIIHIKNDIYTLGKMLRKELISEGVVSKKLVSDSYVSMEFVLSDISWIPEAVYVVTCVTNGKNQDINTKFGNYEFVKMPQKKYAAGVERINEGINYYDKAKPLKALADMIYIREYEWETLKPLHESLRIEYDDLESLTKNDFDELHETYGVSYVEKFLYGIRKELYL